MSGSAMADHRPQSTTSCGILIPGLPNEIALTVLARLPYVDRARLRGVCCFWKHAMEPVAMSSIRKMLHMREEVFLILLSIHLKIMLGYPFAMVDPFSGCFSRISWPPQLQAQRSLLLCTICSVIGHEVLISVEARDRNTATKLVRELEGMYSFDGVCMRWNDVKFASLDPTGRRIRRAIAVDKEGGFLYVDTDGGAVRRLDLKNKMWEALPDPEVRRAKYWGGIIRNRFYIAGGYPALSRYDYRCVPTEVWNPIDRTSERLWKCEKCRSDSVLCPSERLAVVKDQFYALSNKEGIYETPEIMWFEASSQRWISLGLLPEFTLTYITNHSHLVLFAMGEELWLASLPLDAQCFITRMVILTTKPSQPPGPVSWKILLKRHRYSIMRSFYQYAGEMIIP